MRDRTLNLLVPSTEITEDDRKALTAAPDFTKFMEESTKIVQRALKDTHDYTKDYSSGVDGDV